MKNWMPSMTNVNYVMDGYLPNGSYKIKLLDTPFEGIIVTLGKVSFEESGDDMHMRYEYDVVSHPIEFVKEDLDKHIGDMLLQMLEEGVKKNDIVYTGGIDEN